MIGRSGDRPKTCWLCCDFLACWYGKVGVEGGFFIGGDNAPMCLMCRHMSGRAIGLAGALSVRESSWPRCTCCLRSSPPANGGNCTNRDTTRRRHADENASHGAKPPPVPLSSRSFTGVMLPHWCSIARPGPVGRWRRDRLAPATRPVTMSGPSPTRVVLYPEHSHVRTPQGYHRNRQRRPAQARK